MTVRVLEFRGSGAYYLCDPAHELDGLRDGGPGRVRWGGDDVADALRRALRTGAPGRRRGLDCVIAAPKPVSVLLATEPASTARRVVALHERAADAALAYLVDGAARGVAAVGFTHGVNRLLDPHLHTHVVVAAHDQGGAPVDARRMRWRARAADSLYLAALRDGMPAAASRAAWVGRGGATLVEDVDLGVVAAMTSPRRRDGVVERGEEKRHPSLAEVRARWDAVLRGCDRIGSLAPRRARDGAIDEHRFAVELGGERVGHADVVRAWAAACTTGAAPGDVIDAVELVAPGLALGGRLSARVVRDDGGVTVLGARPRAPERLAAWHVVRASLDRYLAQGHALASVADPRGAPAATRLALARLDAELAELGRAPWQRHRGVERGRSLS